MKCHRVKSEFCNMIKSDFEVYLTLEVLFDSLLMSESDGVIKNSHLSGNWHSDKIDLHQSIIK